MFTDNDELAGLLAAQLRVDAVIILTSVEGILADGEVVRRIDAKNAGTFRKYITAEKSVDGRGGMVSKFAVARRLMSSGIAVHIANGKRKNTLTSIMQGKRIGTTFVPRKRKR